MNGKISTVVTAALIAALVMGAAALGAVFARPTPTQAAQPGGGVVRQITVVGSGEAKAAPDRANIQLGVQSEAQTAREALTDNSTKMAGLIDQLKKLGVADKDIQTSNFNIAPTYEPNGRTVTGYQVNNTVSVIIRNLAGTSDLLDKIVSAGANTVYGMSFDIDNPKALQTTARDAAIADARVRADAIAKAAGGSVGQVLTISETIGSPPQPLMRVGAAADQAAAGGAPPVQTGEQTINAQVQITYELK